MNVLVIWDGAAEPRHGDAPTSLDRARTPELDRLAGVGRTLCVRTTPAGLPPGSETGIPTLLGVALEAPIDRGALEAAAYGIDVPAGARAWRVDGPRGTGDRSAQLAAALPDHTVRHLRGFRHLVVGAARPTPGLGARDTGMSGAAPGDDAASSARDAGGADSDRTGATGFTVWPEGASLPVTLDERTVVVAAPGAAAGIGRLLGATVVTPAGATGGTDTDLRAKRRAALAAIDGGAERVVVHVGAPDEAAHDRDADAKVAALEAIDLELVGPLWDAVRAAGGSLAVCPDHGTDPRTGAHDGADVEAVWATAGGAPAAFAWGPAVARPGTSSAAGPADDGGAVRPAHIDATDDQSAARPAGTDAAAGPAGARAALRSLPAGVAR